MDNRENAHNIIVLVMFVVIPVIGYRVVMNVITYEMPLGYAYDSSCRLNDSGTPLPLLTDNKTIYHKVWISQYWTVTDDNWALGAAFIDNVDRNRVDFTSTIQSRVTIEKRLQAHIASEMPKKKK